MWLRRTATGWALATPLRIAALVVGAGAAGGAGLAIYTAVTVGVSELTYALILALISASVIRLSQLRVDIREDGVTVGNLLSTKRVDWRAFDRFTVRTWRGWRGTVLLERHAQHPIPVGVFTTNPMYYDARVEEIVAELNERAARMQTAVTKDERA